MDWTKLLRQAVRNSLQSPVWTCQARIRSWTYVDGADENSCLMAVRPDFALLRWLAPPEPLVDAVLFADDGSWVVGPMWSFVVGSHLWDAEDPRRRALDARWVEFEPRKLLRGNPDRHPGGMLAKLLPGPEVDVPTPHPSATREEMRAEIAALKRRGRA